MKVERWVERGQGRGWREREKVEEVQRMNCCLISSRAFIAQKHDHLRVCALVVVSVSRLIESRQKACEVVS